MPFTSPVHDISGCCPPVHKPTFANTARPDESIPTTHHTRYITTMAKKHGGTAAKKPKQKATQTKRAPRDLLQPTRAGQVGDLQELVETPGALEYPDGMMQPKCANFGISSCCDTPNESTNLILHLRVHSKDTRHRSVGGSSDSTTSVKGDDADVCERSRDAATRVSHRACDSAQNSVPDPANGSSIHQTPYAELLSYSPTVGNDPVAYEPTGTDSAPCTLSSANPAVTKSSGDARRHSDGVGTTAEVLASSETKGVLHEPPARGGTRQSIGSAQVAQSYEVFEVQNDCHSAMFSTPDGATKPPRTCIATTGGVVHDCSGSCAKPLHRNSDTSCCWWCTLPFNWPSYSMPIQHSSSDAKYTTIGVFCSPECCAAYVFDNAGRYGDSWKQYEMLHRMVHKVIDKRRVRIKLAPPRETLRKYGGTYTEEDYRKLINNYRTEVRMIMPPVFPVQTVIEETPADYNKPAKKFVPIDATRVERATNELRLKRKKKQSGENTLETFMRLRVTA